MFNVIKVCERNASTHCRFASPSQDTFVICSTGIWNKKNVKILLSNETIKKSSNFLGWYIKQYSKELQYST